MDVGLIERPRHGWRSALRAVLSTVAIAVALLTIAATPLSAATVDTSAWYVLVNRNSGKAIDVYNFSTADGGRITQWTRTNANNQQWQFVDSGGGYYRLKSRHSGKVLDVYNLSRYPPLQQTLKDHRALVQVSNFGSSLETSLQSRLLAIGVGLEQYIEDLNRTSTACLYYSLASVGRDTGSISNQYISKF